MGGVGELFSGQRFPGKLIEPDDVAALVEAIDEVLTDTDGDDSVTDMIKGLSWDRNAEELKKVSCDFPERKEAGDECKN